MTSGWKGESHRHSMAKRRISTVFKGVAQGKKNHFTTGESLSAFLGTPEGQEYEEKNFESLFEVPWNGYVHGIPYWIDNYEDEVTGENHYGGHSYRMSEHFLNGILQHVPGMYEPMKYGDIETFDGKDYYYATSLGSSEEMEHQAENSELVYSNIGSNFFRVWKPVPETYISVSENGDNHMLMHQGALVATTQNNHRLDTPEKLLEYAKNRYPKIQNLEYDSSSNKFKPFMNKKLFDSIMK